MVKSISTPIGRALVALTLGALVAGICLAGDEPETTGSQAGLSMNLPEQFGEWQGTAGKVSAAELEILPEDTEFAKMNYWRPSAAAAGREDYVHCSIVLSGRDRTSIHRPEVCLVGQGWNIDASSERTVALRNEVDLAVRRLELSRELPDEVVQRALYYYWFVGGEVTTADHLERILLTAKSNVIENRNPRWAYVSVLSGVLPDSGGEDGGIGRTAAMLENFVARVTPEFQSAFATAKLF
jgi:EpsI family protein